MISLRAIIDEVGQTRDLKSLVETYKVIAASSMRRIRSSVLENRYFHLGLNRIFQEVKRAYEGMLFKLAQDRQRRRKKPVLIKKNGKTAYVLLSANTGLYGDIVHKTFSLFKEKLENEHPEEVVVVGRMGEAFLKEAMPSLKHNYFDFPDGKIDQEALKSLIGRLVPYEKVLVFHGVFKNLASQLPTSSYVSGDALAGEDGKEVPEEVKYFFEPSLEGVAAFFETEIFASLLEQSFHESRLAKIASRLMLLDRSGETTDRYLDKLYFQEQKVKHRVFNRKQLEAVSGIYLWNN